MIVVTVFSFVIHRQLYLMKQELQRAQVSSYCERERSSRATGDVQPQADELLLLREEIHRLKSLVELETFSVVNEIVKQHPDVLVQCPNTTNLSSLFLLNILATVVLGGKLGLSNRVLSHFTIQLHSSWNFGC